MKQGTSGGTQQFISIPSRGSSAHEDRFAFDFNSNAQGSAPSPSGGSGGRSHDAALLSTANPTPSPTKFAPGFQGSKQHHENDAKCEVDSCGCSSGVASGQIALLGVNAIPGAARAYFITCLLYFGALGPIPLDLVQNSKQFAAKSV